MLTRPLPGFRALLRAGPLLLLLTAGAQAQEATPAAAPAPATAPAPARKEEFVKLGDGAVRSPFSKPTVLKLNAIVRRSKAAIDGYDAIAAAARADVAAAAKKGASRAVRAKAGAELAKIRALCTEAASARADMAAAKAALEAGKEEYNASVLAGMVGFTVDVDTELTKASSALSAKLAAH